MFTLKKTLVCLALSVSVLNRWYLRNCKECFRSVGLPPWYVLQDPPAKTVGGSYILLRTSSARRTSSHVTAFDTFSPDFPKSDELYHLILLADSSLSLLILWMKWHLLILPVSLFDPCAGRDGEQWSPSHCLCHLPLNTSTITSVVFALAEALWSVSS